MAFDINRRIIELMNMMQLYAISQLLRLACEPTVSQQILRVSSMQSQSMQWHGVK